MTLGAFASHHRGVDFRPARLTPTHALAEELGAVFVETGPWLRAAYFPRRDETDWKRTVDREVRTVRNSVGLIDVSIFGKIDLQGSDVGTLLDRVYINMFSTLPAGKARYGVMLREDGFVMDDGTTAQLGENRWVMTTTTAHAAKVRQHLEFCLSRSCGQNSTCAWPPSASNGRRPPSPVAHNGALRDTCVYSVIQSEWPTIRAHLEWRLAKPRENRS